MICSICKDPIPRTSEAPPSPDGNTYCLAHKPSNEWLIAKALVSIAESLEEISNAMYADGDGLASIAERK